MPAFFICMKLSAARLLLLALTAVAGGRSAPATPHLLLLDGALTPAGIIAVGERGTILRSTDQGRSWQDSVVPPAATLTGVSFAPGSPHGWAVGHDALILTTADSGQTWQRQWQGENLQESFLDVLALDAQHIIAVGAYGLFVTTADGGKSWSRRKILEGDFHFNRLTRGPGGALYLAGEHGTLLRSRDLGATWQPIDSPYDGSFYGILPLDATTLLAYGLRGRIYRSTDDGGTWTLVPNDQRMLLATAVQLRSGTVVFAGQSRAWFLSHDGGKTVAPWPVTLTAAVAKLLALPDGSLLALGEAGANLLPAP